jgi:hypothetical protein
MSNSPENGRHLTLYFLALFVILASLWCQLNASPQRHQEHQGRQELQKGGFSCAVAQHRCMSNSAEKNGAGTYLGLKMTNDE